nr:uroporphyrinogen-III synthase [Allopusillimonas soli]
MTRPKDKNAVLAQRLRQAGMSVLELPALKLVDCEAGPASQYAPVRYDLVVLVSGYACRRYLQWQLGLDYPRTDAQATSRQASATASPARAAWPPDTLAATVGQASARILYDSAVVPGSAIIHPAADQSADSEHLWQQLLPRMDRIRRVLIVRGESGREWLADRLEQAGASVDKLALYRREAARWSAEEGVMLHQAMSAPQPCVVLLTSREGVDAALANGRRLALDGLWASARFVVVHERIADYLQSRLPPSGKAALPMVKISQPGDDALFESILEMASCQASS